MSKASDLVKNTIILAVGKLSSQIITFLMLPFYTAYLTASEYGTVDLIVIYAGLVAPIITLSLDEGVFRFLVDARGERSEIQRVTSCALRVVLTLLLPFVILFMCANALLPFPYASLMLSYFCVLTISGLFLQVARGLGMNVVFAIAGTITAATTLISGIIFIVMMHLGAIGMLLSLVVANFVSLLYLLIAVRIDKFVNLKIWDRQLTKQLLGYALPLMPNRISWWVVDLSDRVIVTLILGATANGVYAVSSKFALVFASVFSVFGLSWAESASLHINSEDRDSFLSRVTSQSLRLFGGLGLLMLAYVPLFFDLMFGREYQGAYLYIPPLILGAFFSSLVSIYGAIYSALKRTIGVMKTSVAGAVVNIILNIALIRIIGLWAAAGSTAVTYLAMALYRHFDLKKYVRISFDRRVFVELGALFAVVGTSYYWSNDLALRIFVAVVITVAVLVLNLGMVRSFLRLLIARLR